MADIRLTVKHRAPLLAYLLEAFAGQSRTGVKSYLSAGRTEVNGKAVSAFDYCLEPGDIITIRQKGQAGKRTESLPGGIRIVYEDDDLIVADKPSGLLTVSAGREGQKTAYSILTDHVRAQSGKRDAGVFIVHRIDRGTSGLLVFAKNLESRERLQDGWNSNIIERKYTAIVEGCPEPAEGTVRSWLRENPKSLKMSSSPYDNGGREAVTHYRVTAGSGRYSSVEFELETGRKNQIRVHAAVLGCPIAGDRKYGAGTDPAGRMALHAGTLVFRHPRSGKIMSFSSPVPESMSRLVLLDTGK